jgi:hypothetical protein
MRPYHIATATQYQNLKAAKEAFGILGLNADNAADHGFVITTQEPFPDVSASEKPVLSDSPTENEDGSWSYKWAVIDKTAGELNADQERERARVNAERDRRLFSTFTFAGVVYDCDDASLARITGAATLAGFAMGAGAAVGWLRWANSEKDFAWITADNSLTTMDAQTCFAFGQAAANNQSAHIFAGAAIKAMDPIPEDYATNESYWP